MLVSSKAHEQLVLRPALLTWEKVTGDGAFTGLSQAGAHTKYPVRSAVDDSSCRTLVQEAFSTYTRAAEVRVSVDVLLVLPLRLQGLLHWHSCACCRKACLDAQMAIRRLSLLPAELPGITTDGTCAKILFRTARRIRATACKPYLPGQKGMQNGL